MPIAVSPDEHKHWAWEIDEIKTKFDPFLPQTLSRALSTFRSYLNVVRLHLLNCSARPGPRIPSDLNAWFRYLQYAYAVGQRVERSGGAGEDEEGNIPFSAEGLFFTALSHAAGLRLATFDTITHTTSLTAEGAVPDP